MDICFCESQLSPELPKRHATLTIISCASIVHKHVLHICCCCGTSPERKSQPTVTGTCIAL